MLADIYKADPSHTYQIGGWTGDEWTYEYSNKLYDIFPLETKEIDLSICIAGNIDCDHFNSITMDYFPYRMLVKDSESSDPNYRKMVVDEKFTGYKTGKLLGSCLISTNNSGYSTWSVTDRVMRVGTGDLSDARFFLGNKVKGFKNIVFAPTDLSVEKIPPVTSSNLQYSGNSFEYVHTLENIENRVLKSFAYNVKHFERKTNLIECTNFANAYKPQLAFFVQCEDGELLLVSANGLFNRSNGGLISNFQNGIPISYTFGQMIENPEWQQMCTDVTRPQWTSRPPLGNVAENLNSMYCEVYTSRSTWYIYSSKLFLGALARRIFTMSGLFFSWDTNGIDSGISPDTFNSKLCLGQRDEYGNILQDGYNKGWEEIQKNDEYVDKLDYNNLPTVNPNPPLPDADDVEKMEIGGWYTAGGMVNYYALSDVSKLEQLSENLSDWDYVATGKDVLRNLISLKAFPVTLEKLIHKGLAQKEIIIAGTETGVNAWAVDSTYDVINMGSISIPTKFDDFRDYAPYTKVEIFIPFCGWVSLPSHCMGRTVSVKLTYDIIAGTCKAFVFLDDNTIVSEISGVMSMDIPFTAEAVGMKSAGVISGVLGVASSVLGAGVGIATGNIIGTASGTIGVANSISQLISSNNANYTEVKGNTGDANNFAGIKTCFLKITRPVSHVPDNYARTVGWLYNKTETLVDGLGFTVIDNPQINGNMTEEERNEIKTLLSRGVIL